MVMLIYGYCLWGAKVELSTTEFVSAASNCWVQDYTSKPMTVTLYNNCFYGHHRRILAILAGMAKLKQ